MRTSSKMGKKKINIVKIKQERLRQVTFESLSHLDNLLQKKEGAIKKSDGVITVVWR